MTVSIFRTLTHALTPDLQPVLEWDFIPWKRVEERHSGHPGPGLEALVRAYGLLGRRMDLPALASRAISPGNWGCERCGFCCTSMRPGPVPETTYLRWEEAGAPAAWFCGPTGNSGKGRTYRFWYSEGTRLRMCPFMLVNLNDLLPFCSIYHLGDDFRPSACSRYVPMHRTCRSAPIPLDPWENV